MNKLTRDDFPAMPKCKGKWTPIYIEPMMLSGERLVVAIVVCCDDGGLGVTPAIPRAKLNCMYGDKAYQLQRQISMVENSIASHIAKSGGMDGWVAPFSGVFAGDSRNAASDSIGGITRQGMQMCASLWVDTEH